MPYYGDHMDGDPGLFGKIFKGIKKIRLGHIIGQAVLPGLGFRPASPAPGVVTQAQATRSVIKAAPTSGVILYKKRKQPFAGRGTVVSPYQRLQARNRAR